MKLDTVGNSRALGEDLKARSVCPSCRTLVESLNLSVVSFAHSKLIRKPMQESSPRSSDTLNLIITS